MDSLCVLSQFRMCRRAGRARGSRRPTKKPATRAGLPSQLDYVSASAGSGCLPSLVRNETNQTETSQQHGIDLGLRYWGRTENRKILGSGRCPHAENHSGRAFGESSEPAVSGEDRVTRSRGFLRIPRAQVIGPRILVHPKRPAGKLRVPPPWKSIRDAVRPGARARPPYWVIRRKNF